MPTSESVVRSTRPFALDVADRCCILLISSSPLDDELAACRQALAEGDPETLFPSVVAARSLIRDVCFARVGFAPPQR